MQKTGRAYKIFLRMGMTLATAAVMLFFAAPTGAQVPPAGLVCQPMPASGTPEFDQCIYYMGLNNIQNVDDNDPNTNMPSSRPASCNPLPTDQAMLEACIYYMGFDTPWIAANNPPVTPVAPPPVNPPTPGLPNSQLDTSVISNLVSQVYVYALGLSGLLAVSVSVWGGYMVMTARGNAAQAQKGKERIISGLVGMALLFGSYILLNTINPDLTDFTVQSDSLDIPAAGGNGGGNTTP